MKNWPDLVLWPTLISSQSSTSILDCKKLMSISIVGTNNVNFCWCRIDVGNRQGNPTCSLLGNSWDKFIQSKITRLASLWRGWSLYHNYRWIPPLWPEHKSLIQFSSVFVENCDQSKVIFPQNQTFVIISIIINNEVNFFCIQRYFDIRWSFHININFLKMQYQRR